MPELTSQLLVNGFIWYVVFLFSTTCHEAAHALAGKLGGDDTAGEQVTLNPVPHIQREPWGMVVIPIASFLINHSMIGWASAPYDPLWERRHPRRAARMALAGPSANFTLMILAAIGLRIGISGGWALTNPATGAASFVGEVLFVFFSLNLLLGTFNLLPFPPLDGSTVIMLFMSENTAQRYLGWLRENNFSMAGLLIGLVIFRYAYAPLHDFALAVLLWGHS
jgi:Zn-dependent protease